MTTGTPEVGAGTSGPVDVLVLPLFGLLLAGVITGLVAAVTVALLQPLTGAGLRPPEQGYDPFGRLGVPVGCSVLGTAAVAVLGLPSAWLGVGASTTGVALRVLLVGVVLGVVLHRLHFGAADRRVRRAGRYSYGVFAVVWTATTAVYYAFV